MPLFKSIDEVHFKRESWTCLVHEWIGMKCFTHVEVSFSLNLSQMEGVRGSGAQPEIPILFQILWPPPRLHLLRYRVTSCSHGHRQLRRPRGVALTWFLYAGVSTWPPNPYPSFLLQKFRKRRPVSCNILGGKPCCFNYKFGKDVSFRNNTVGKWRIVLNIFENCRCVIHSVPENTPFLLHLC